MQIGCTRLTSVDEQIELSFAFFMRVSLVWHVPPPADDANHLNSCMFLLRNILLAPAL